MQGKTRSNRVNHSEVPYQIAQTLMAELRKHDTAAAAAALDLTTTLWSYEAFSVSIQ